MRVRQGTKDRLAERKVREIGSRAELGQLHAGAEIPGDTREIGIDRERREPGKQAESQD
jgi:hypothetical protein